MNEKDTFHFTDSIGMCVVGQTLESINKEKCYWNSEVNLKDE